MINSQHHFHTHSSVSHMVTFSPILWWKGVLKNTKAEINHEFSRLVPVHLLSAPVGSASIECIFSNFGYIHNKLRNCLCGATAAKLVFCYYMLHGSGPEDWDIGNDCSFKVRHNDEAF